LAKVEVFAENKLFATVDSTVRKVVLENIPFLLTDTVGFIRKLPTTLIESFKSTLDEVREADILLHVVDIAHGSFEEQIEIVNQTLTEIKAIDKPTILVFNKIDAFSPKMEAFDEVIETEEGEVVVEQTKEMVLEKLKKSYLTGKADHVVFISAENKENLEELRNMLFELVKDKHFFIYPNWKSVDFSTGMASNFDFDE